MEANALIQDWIDKLVSYSSENILVAFTVIFLLTYISRRVVNYVVVYNFKKEVYAGPFMLWSLLKSRKGAWLVAVISGLIAGMGYLNSSLELHPINEILVHGAGGILCYYTCFYERNFYFNQGYWIDRILIALLFVLSINYVFFYLAFVFYALLFIKQAKEPNLSYFTFTDKLFFYEILLFTPLYTFVAAYIPFDPEQVYLTLAIWLFPTLWYVAAGGIKIAIRWWKSYPERFFYNTKISGLLRRFNGLLTSLYAITKRFRILTIWFIILIEIGAMCIFAGKSIAIVLLAALILMHVFIFIASGIIFWKWMIFDTLLILAILVFEVPDSLFSVQSTLFLLGLVGLSFVLPHHFVYLGWYEIGGFGYHTYRLVREDGVEVEVDPSFFAPYDLPFVQDRFVYLHDKKILFDSFGATRNRAVNKVFKDILNREAVEAAVEQFGTNKYNPAKKAVFDAFVVQFVRNKLREKNPVWIASLMHVYRRGGHRRFIPQGVFTQLKIQYVELYKPNLEESIPVFESTYTLDLH